MQPRSYDAPSRPHPGPPAGWAGLTVMCGHAGVITSNGQPVRFKKTLLQLPRPPARPLQPIRQTATTSMNDYEVRLP